MPLGRPVKFDVIKQAQVCSMLSLGCSRVAAARYVGVSTRTIRRTIEENAAFRQRFRQAEMAAEAGLLRQIRRASRKSWQAAAWLLQRIDPKRYLRFNTPDADQNDDSFADRYWHYALEGPDTLDEAATPDESETSEQLKTLMERDPFKDPLARKPARERTCKRMSWDEFRTPESTVRMAPPAASENGSVRNVAIETGPATVFPRPELAGQSIAEPTVADAEEVAEVEVVSDVKDVAATDSAAAASSVVELRHDEDLEAVAGKAEHSDEVTRDGRTADAETDHANSKNRELESLLELLPRDLEKADKHDICRAASLAISRRLSAALPPSKPENHREKQPVPIT